METLPPSAPEPAAPCPVAVKPPVAAERTVEVHFTADQERACDVSQRHLDSCIVAGPGSGKTTVLVEYFRRLVAEGIDPLRILAITFTEKAAGNMRKRLARAFHDDSEIRARLERAWVSTIHGFCARLLRENAVFAGIDPEFRVADERESWRMQQESLAAAIDAVLAEQAAEMRALIRGLSSYYFEEAMLDAYDAMRGAGVRVEQLAAFPASPGVTMQQIAETLAGVRRDPLSGWSHSQKQEANCAKEGAQNIVSASGPLDTWRAMDAFSCNLQKCKANTAARNLLKLMKGQIAEARYTVVTQFYAAQREALLHILTRFDLLYRERKREAGLLDFADLEEFAVSLLEGHPEARARLQAQFDHILMDEFQDTNGQQAKLMRLVRPPDRFYAVGDINQSIFGFRHAEPEGFSSYRDEIVRGGRRLVHLVDNFRSRAEILSAVETIVDGAPGIESRRLVAGRKFQTGRDECVELIVAPNLKAEAEWLAVRAGSLAEEFEFRDMAVLVRNTEVIPEFTAAFDAAGIPYLVYGGRGFYDTREVNDLTHLLRVIANPRDEISLAVVLRSPLVGASDEALLRLRIMSHNIGQSLRHLPGADAAGSEFSAGDREKLTRFAQRLHEWRLRREYVSFDRLLLTAIDDCGYLPDAGGRGANGGRAAANIDKFLAQAREASSRMSLDEFVEELALVRESNPREPDAPPEDSANALQIMTVHSAKGLEFPVVFVAAIHKGVDSKPPVVAFSRRYGLGARWRTPASGQEDSSSAAPAPREQKDDTFMHALRAEWKDREARESDRLLYVAMTRAEQHLCLSFSVRDHKPANWAGDVSQKLSLDVQNLRDEVLTYAAPDGKPWKLKLLVTDRAPEPPPFPEPSRYAKPALPVKHVAPPALAGQQDSNTTVTALAKFAACPRQYYLGHYLGFERTPAAAALRTGSADADADLTAGEFGTQVHALLAGTPVPEAGPEALRLARVFRQSALGRRAARASRAEREFDFLMAIDGLVIRGQVDLWFEEGGELTVVDYKTDDVTPIEAHQRAQDYGLQLRLYAMAVERAAGRPPDRAWLHFLRPDKTIAVDLSPTLLESPEQTVRDFQEAQSRLEFPLNEGQRCRRCPFYRGLCPAGLV